MRHLPAIQHLLSNLAIFLVCGICLVRCNAAASRDTEKEPLKNAAVSPGGPTMVTTSMSTYKMFRLLITANGKISSRTKLVMRAPFNGTIAHTPAANGKRVAAETMLLQLETTPIQHKLERARLAHAKSQQEYESQLLGYESLLTNKPADEANTIRKKLMISTGLAAAGQDIREAEYELTISAIRAPFAGVLADVKVQRGQSVLAGDELFTLYDPANLFLEVKLLESDIGLIKKGTMASISQIAPGLQPFQAFVQEINPFVDENGQVLVKLRIQTPGNSFARLFPGMNCTAVIGVDVVRSVVVPRDAVVVRSGKNVVFTLEAGEAVWNYVTIGRDNGREVEIRSGLRPDMKVITSNNLQLSNNAPVREMPDSLKTDK